MMSLILSDGTAFHAASVTGPLPQVLPTHMVRGGMLLDAHALELNASIITDILAAACATSLQKRKHKWDWQKHPEVYIIKHWN